jgi:hypothetical protein
MNNLAKFVIISIVVAVSALASSNVFAARMHFKSNSDGDRLISRVTSSQWGSYSVQPWAATQGSEFKLVFTDGSTETFYTANDGSQWGTVDLRNSVFNALINQNDGRIGVYYTWNGDAVSIDTNEQYTSRALYSHECTVVSAGCYKSVQSWTEI